MLELIVGLITVIGGLLFKVKWDSGKIKGLKEVNAMNEKKAVITDKIKESDKVIEIQVKEALKDIDSSKWKDKI